VNMHEEFTISIDLRVTDKKALHAAAFARCIADGLSVRQAFETIGTRRSPKLGDCLQMILDPGVSPDGTEIQNSSWSGQ